VGSSRWGEIFVPASGRSSVRSLTMRPSLLEEEAARSRRLHWRRVRQLAGDATTDWSGESGEAR
jgi:hypothetical protein